MFSLVRTCFVTPLVAFPIKAGCFNLPPSADISVLMTLDFPEPRGPTSSTRKSSHACLRGGRIDCSSRIIAFT